jgi:hypothetical protein
VTASKIVVPDFQWANAFYYPELVRRIRLFNRTNAPEITAETAEEPFIQAERAFALVGHLEAVLLDVAAKELCLDTAELRESVRLILKGVDYDLADYSPSVVDVLLELAQVPTASVRLLDPYTVFSTERDDETEAIDFERVAALDVGPADVVDGVFGVEWDRSGSDGAAVVGDPDAFESATMAVSPADVGKEIEVTGSIVGNNGVFAVAEVLVSGVLSRVRLAGTLGGEAPLFIYETGLTWKLRSRTANGAAAVNTAGAPGFAPWTAVHVGDQLYVGSRHVLWDELGITLRTPGSGFTGVWEYFDPELSEAEPDAIANLGTALKLTLTTLLGATNHAGALVKVTYLPTGASELLPTTWDGALNVVQTSAFLGQSGTPSLVASDYAVGTAWNPLPDAVDDSTNLRVDGAVHDYEFPQTGTRDWRKVEVGGVEGFYLRYRVVAAPGGSTSPEVDRLRIDGGTQYVVAAFVQGETIRNESAFSSNGQPRQTFELAVAPALRDTVRMFVNEGGGEVEWTNVTARGRTLLASGPRDRHFAVDQDALGVLTARTGDGTFGKVPPLGTDNVRFEYRHGAERDGNVGAGTVTVNSSGADLVKSVTNPRPASGWREAEGATPETLAVVKETGPAAWRTAGRAVAPHDYEELALAFRTAAGTRPVVRAKAIEEGFGPKTIKLVVVGTNGVAIPSSVKAELERYFNGDETLGVEGVGGSNTEVTVVNFVPRLVPLSIRVESSVLTETLVKTRLATLLNPTAKETDGFTWTWRFGGRVPLSRVGAEIFQILPGKCFDVDVSVPSEDLELLEDELPILDTDDVHVSIVAA